MPDENIVSSTNRLLSLCGITETPPFTSVTDLQENASSMFVAVFEAIFSTRIEKIIRKPTSIEDYAFNAQRVIDSLRSVLPSKVVLPVSITGETISGGDVPSLIFLVSLLTDVLRVVAPTRSSVASTATGSVSDESTVHPHDESVDGSGGGSSIEHRTILSENNFSLEASLMAFEAAKSVISTTTASQTQVTKDANILPSGGGSDIWSGVSPQKVRSRAHQAGLGSSQTLPTPPTAKSPILASNVGTKGGVKSPRSPTGPPIKHKNMIIPMVDPVRPAIPVSRPRANAVGATMSSSTASTTTATKTSTTPRKVIKRVAAPPIPGGDLDGEEHHHPHIVAATEAASPRSNPAHSQRISSALDKERADAEDKEAAYMRASQRKEMGITQRMLKAQAEEGELIQKVINHVVKSREADFRVMEGKVLRAALQRARAAKHERKVLTARTKRTVEDLARTTLGLRLARSSKQASAASALLRSLASQERLAAAESLKAEAEARTKTLSEMQGRVAWLSSGGPSLDEIALEEAAKQVHQRQAAAESQRQALLRAVREMRADEAALLERVKDNMRHAEEAFLAQHVDPMKLGAEIPQFAPKIALERATDMTDTDIDPMRVQTIRTTRQVIARGAESRRKEANVVQAAINRAGDEAAKTFKLANALEAGNIRTN
jgi:hypothetical protein